MRRITSEAQMSMTPNDQQHPAHQANYDEPYTLLVKAQVEIVDQSGTAVPARSMAAAIRTIRSRFHEDVPLIALDAQHQGDPLFSGSTQGWLVTETAIMPIDGEPLLREPDYRLRYHQFTLSDPTAAGRPQTPCQPDALVPVAMKAADTAGKAIQLSSQLLGFTHPVLRPGDSAHQQDQTPQQDHSILDTLDPDLFTTSEQLIMVHPPEPLRQANVVTIPDATGVVYNAEAGDYPIDGEGISVQAYPTEGYQFPEETTTAWDYEYRSDLSSAQTPLGGLSDIVAEADTSVIDTANTDLSDTAPDPLSWTPEPSTALVLHTKDASPWWKRRKTIVYGAIALSVLLFTGLLILFLRPGANSAPEPQSPPAGDAPWISTVAPTTPADESITDNYSIPLWDLDSGQAAELSWYSAGVAHIDPNDDALVLRATLSGDETARIELEEPVEWTSEFMADDTPAIGARTESSFLAITADGDTASWEIDAEATLQVTGSTPMLTTDTGEVYALIVGEDNPVPVEGNPDYRAAAIDSHTLIQFAAGMPRVVTLPMNEEDDAAELRLEPPTRGASFGRHLAVGHGLTLTEWEVDDQDYLVVHDLQNDAAITAAVPSIDDAQGWSLGRGMDLAIIGPYAFDLESGELVAESASTDFVSALGDAAIGQGEAGREIIIEGESFHETERVIGYTGGGTIIVRQPDGSVAALSEGSGTV